jgi:hypothetical protein
LRVQKQTGRATRQAVWHLIAWSTKMGMKAEASAQALGRVPRGEN